MLRDRRFLACLAVGVGGALASRWLVSSSVLASFSGGVRGPALWVYDLVALVPLLAGLVAVVLTGLAVERFADGPRVPAGDGRAP